MPQNGQTHFKNLAAFAEKEGKNLKKTIGLLTYYHISQRLLYGLYSNTFLTLSACLLETSVFSSKRLQHRTFSFIRA